MTSYFPLQFICTQILNYANDTTDILHFFHSCKWENFDFIISLTTPELQEIVNYLENYIQIAYSLWINSKYESPYVMGDITYLQ